MSGKIAKLTKNLYRGYRPNSFADLKKYKENEYQNLVVFNLEEGWFELFSSSSYEKENAADFDMTEMNCNLSDFFAPSVYELTSIVDNIQHNLDLGSVVYIHCKWGKDRTGMVCAAYRILKQGWSVESAIEELHSFGFHTFPYKFWLKNLYKLKA